jgi:hypothetical protein
MEQPGRRSSDMHVRVNMRVPLLVDDRRFQPARREATVDRFIHQKNLEHFRRLLAEPDVAKDREQQDAAETIGRRRKRTNSR